ncbi:MAG TPA: GPW/gp25 family protein [Terrimicrobiaceae bacterium]
MDEDQFDAAYTSFLGTGWSFPPEFVQETGEVLMTSDEEDIHASLIILLGTAFGERFLNPKYGIDMQELLFEPMSTTMTTFVKDRVKTAILIDEPRINVISLEIDTSAQFEGKVALIVEYEVRTTNSRFNLVFPFSTTDASEVRASIKALS